MKKTFVIFISLLLVALSAQAQSSKFEDYTYPHTAVKERKAVPYRYIREANVKWSKRIERVIDVREKQNKIIHWPRNPFYLIVWNAAMDGSVPAYRDDSLTSILTPEDITKMASIESTVSVPNPDNPDDPYDLIQVTVTETYSPSKIEKYRIMEDWIFDYNNQGKNILFDEESLASTICEVYLDHIFTWILCITTYLAFQQKIEIKTSSCVIM